MGVVLHEFGHALGLGHEHQGPLANIPFITLGPNSIYLYYNTTFGWSVDKVDQEILKKYYPEQVNISGSFDSESIMLYFYPAKITENGVGGKVNQILSITDAVYLSNLYPIITNKKITPDLYYKIILGKYNTLYPEYAIDDKTGMSVL